MTRLVKIGLICLVCTVATGFNAVAAQRLKIGLLLPLTGPAAVDIERVVRIFTSSIERFEDRAELVIRDTTRRPEVAIRSFQQLVLQDKVDFVVGPIFAGTSLGVIEAAGKLETPLLVLASDFTGRLEKAYRDSKWAIGFGRLPQSQFSVIKAELAAQSARASGGEISVLGLGSLADEVHAMVNANKPTGATIIGPMYPSSFQPADLNQFFFNIRKSRLIIGLSGLRVANALYGRFSEQRSDSSMILFQAPPLTTRAYVMGRLVDHSLSQIGEFEFERGSFMAAARGFERFVNDRGSLELNYSMVMYSASDEAEGQSGKAAEQQRGNRSNDTQSSSTEVCSCRDSNEKLKNCIDCMPNTCKKDNDGTDSCTTSCT